MAVNRNDPAGAQYTGATNAPRRRWRGRAHPPSHA